MIDKTIDEMLSLVAELKNSINEDIEDIKKAKHENLLKRNDRKQEIMESIVSLKEKLNSYLVNSLQKNEDINEYRTKVDNLEEQLRQLHKLNGRLASIVLPVHQMYKDIVEELTAQNGGSVFEIKV